MYRIRFHGRGGQGMKTASRILGKAFFIEGYEVQDAPRYGAERRGAPNFAYVRAAKHAINERGVIREPDMAVVADDTLVALPAASVLQGISERTVLLINTALPAETWRHRLSYKGPLLTLPLQTEDAAQLRFVGAACVGAAARLLGVISRNALERALRDELVQHGEETLALNLELALSAYDSMAEHAGTVVEGAIPAAAAGATVQWVDLPEDSALQGAAAIRVAANSVEVRTGLWRTLRPVVDYDRCHHCWWVCSEFCPDSAIHVRADQTPEIDYDHCKGCLICVAQCPSHAIRAEPEREREAQA
jgi:pyruvate ferredoxin oxidoreductase gamma subunit